MAKSSKAARRKAARRKAARISGLCLAARGAFRDLLYCRAFQLEAGAIYARQAFAKSAAAGLAAAGLAAVGCSAFLEGFGKACKRFEAIGQPLTAESRQEALALILKTWKGVGQ